jgi:dihydrofolate reductase
MTRMVFNTATTLDGYLADENDSLEWLFVQDHDDSGPFGFEEYLKGVGAIVMGATTYEWLLDHLGRTGEAWSYEQPTWVFTHRELPLAADNVRLTSAPVKEVYDEMVAAAQGKELWMVGGGGLAADFATEGLLDEVVVSIAPVTLGAGRPLFPRPFDLRLVDLARNGAFLCARYEVVGPR